MIARLANHPEASLWRGRLETALMAAIAEAKPDMDWAVDNCTFWPADIIREALGYDPVEPGWRGSFTDRASCMRRLIAAGGLGALIARAADRHGWLQCDPDEAQVGDIGIAILPTRYGVSMPSVLICRAKGWFVGRSESGAVMLRHDADHPRVNVCWNVLPLDHPVWKGLPQQQKRKLVERASGVLQMSQEPVSAVSLATALFAAGEAAFVATAAQTALAAALLTTAQIAATAAISIGLTYASQALFNQSGSDSIGAAGTVNPAVAKISTRQSAPPKRIPYGTVHCGGALLFEEVKPPYLYRMYAVSAREINAFKKIYIGTRDVPFSSLAPNAILQPLQVPENPPFHSRLLISIRHGTADQAICPLLAQDFPNLASTYRQRGIATITLRYHFGSSSDERQALWGIYGDPQPFWLLEGVKVFDPRDSAQVIDDANTWKFSNNATLCQTDYLRAEYGGRIKSSRIDIDKTIAGANYDDELMGCANGELIRRHTVDGLILLNQSPADVMSGMLASNRAAIAMNGRKVWISSSMPKDPVATIYDAIIAGGIEYQADKQKRDLVNTVQTRFVAPEREYNLTDGPILVDNEAVTDDGETLMATLQFPFVNDHRRVQRLQKAFKDTSRKGRKISVPCDLRLLAEATDELVDNPVRFSSDLFPQCDGIYKVNQFSLSDNFTTLTADCSEYDKAIETGWTPSSDEQAFTIADLDVS